MSATTTVIGLEQRLFERAEKKLRSVLSERLNKHLAGLTVTELATLVGDYRNWELASIHQLSNVITHLVNKHIDEYVKAETDLFLAEIDRLKSEVDNLNERFEEVIQ